MNERLDELLGYPFHRLNALLAELEPGGPGEPVALSIGEPQRSPPDLVRPALDRAAALWGRYPPATGTPEFRRAVADWLARRFGLPPGLVDPDRHIAPSPGSREGLFMLALVAVPPGPAGGRGRPAVIVPNPFYHAYDGAAVMTGAERVLLDATAANGFLPGLAAVDEAVLARTALAYLCNPMNPQGTVYDLDRLIEAVRLARRHGFLLAVDECYSEIYDGQPPPGALQACAELGQGLDNVVVLHSLSKRSSAPGLRSGFVAGDAGVIERLVRLISYGGVATPGPVLAAATALWGDDAHVAETRAFYRANFDLAERLLGRHPAFYRPEAGFFLWLDVGDGEATARRLWREAGVKCMPGGYMARATADGENPGRRYVRLALVHEPAVTEEALTRVAAHL
jgi:aspartate/methionine/tyrosine aminotransferase